MTPTSTWIEVTVPCGPAAVEAVEAALLSVGSEGTSAATSPPGAGAAPVLVRGYLRTGPSLPASLEELNARLAILREAGLPVAGTPSEQPIYEEDWANAWRAFYRPRRVGRRLVIKPGWEPFPAAAGELVVELDPGMAFGTGEHPTTRLCLEALEERVAPGERVLDWGTGSGILAIAAARLGAARVDAVDSDPVAVTIARANVERNGVADRVRVAEGGLDREGPYDGVVANILADPIIAAAPQLARRVRPGGWLAVSGVTRERRDELTAALREAGFAPPEMRSEGDWVCLVMSMQGR